MCRICKIASESIEYHLLIEKMDSSDMERITYSKEAVKNLRPISKMLYSSMKLPVKLLYPMFEARAAFSVPNNYFQNLFLDNERLGVSFAHGAMRSIFFIGEKLVLFSKTVNHQEGKEFFTSFTLVHFNPGEYSYEWNGDELTIKADIEKPLRNLISGEMEKKKITFNFTNKSVKGRIVTSEQVRTSSQFKNVYSKYGGSGAKSASIDMEGYALTVPHYSPHPYMLQLHAQFGYSSNREFQEKLIDDYFKMHLPAQRNKNVRELETPDS